MTNKLVLPYLLTVCAMCLVSSVGFATPTDSDADGVNDYREGKDGTNPNDATSFNPLSKGLVAYYPFDGNAKDESGNGNNGGVQEAILAADRRGLDAQAYSFDGINDCIKIEPSQSLTGIAKTVTVVAWIYSEGLAALPTPYPDARDLQGIFGPATWFVSDGGFFLRLKDPVYDAQNDRRYDFAVSLPYEGGQSSSVAPINSWDCIVATYDGNAVRIYRNGILDASKAVGGLTSTLKSSGRYYTIGQCIDWAASSITQPFRGKIDDVRIYNRALSPTEVGQLYQTEAGNLDSDGDGLTDAWERGLGRYQIVQGNFTWQQAKAHAEARGGHLGTITSQAEQDLIVSFFEPELREGRAGTWIGAYQTSKLDEPSGNWAWVNGEQWSFTNWNVAPDNYQGDQDYGYIIGDFLGFSKWDDAPLAADVTRYLLEYGYPTDPFKADTDGDGFNDKVESDAKTDPNNPASQPPDTDSDGILDVYETNTGTYASATDTGTDPAKADTDGDGLNDGVEKNTGVWVGTTDTGTDPNNADSDGDGLKDGAETNTGTYVSATNTGTNPLLDDTSGDGITDGEAVAAQFNPLVDQRPVLNFLTQAVAAQPNRFGFYNEANVMHLGMGGLMIRKSGSVVNLDLQWQTKNSLTNPWTNHGSPLPFFLNLPGSKAFIRLQATPGAP